MRHTEYAASSAAGRLAAVVLKHGVQYGHRGALDNDCTSEIESTVSDEGRPLHQSRWHILREVDEAQVVPIQKTDVAHNCRVCGLNSPITPSQDSSKDLGVRTLLLWALYN